MNCKSANKQISLLIDGLLDKKAELALREHMGVCKACQTQHNAMQNAVDKLHALPEESLPEGLENRLHFALQHEVLVPRKRNWMKVTAIAMPVMAAAFAAIIGFNYIFSGGLSKTEMAQDKAAVMEVAPAPEAALQERTQAKKEAPTQKAETAQSNADALEESVEGKAFEAFAEDEALMQIPPEFYVRITLEGGDVSEMRAVAFDMVRAIDDSIESDAFLFDDATQTLRVLIQAQYYDAFLGNAENHAQVQHSETQHMQDRAYDDTAYFEVTFLFQKK